MLSTKRAMLVPFKIPPLPVTLLFTMEKPRSREVVTGNFLSKPYSSVDLWKNKGDRKSGAPT